MTKELGARENEKQTESRTEDLPRHPAARPRAEADRELVPPDADLDEDRTVPGSGGRR
ncbi:hypothetical protein Ait01nite_074180 [Actinoplanes italicus]|uniref:Uncharacterized protein n=1 Tax=Actinoplanes italicus TaxID=113567 RepID=A0A2T0K0I7_9ACTN|nr:hypothetical protein [Actinoplanes italicus]PRX16297.1 hypothetical protein CLV67_120112 [Actinoplanes italicus]GIE34373.1 hypothetical protein Ait01nite_074180 [Actinoplanes italicus]